MPSEIWLVRHGETEWSRSGQHTSRTDLPLTPEGERQAANLKRMLAGHSLALVLSSPMKRAVDTARLVGLTPQLDNDLREWDYGDYEGLTTAEIQKRVPDWTIWTGAPPNGETIEQVAARADRVIARALAAGGDVALFGHGHLLRVLGARWIGLEPSAGRLLALSTASVSVLGYERETRVIRLWNQTS
ncbi:MAG: Phosphoglycerate mutase [Bryobacterales bacterium]|nr:Phosphoglycerate mutase [Bryobacterales bacterium]